MDTQQASRSAVLPQPQPERLTYTLASARAASDLSIATLYRHAKAGRLKLHKVGGRTLVCAASLRELLAGQGA